MLAGTGLCCAGVFFNARHTVLGANNSFILRAQEMNHRCNLIKLRHNVAVRATALFLFPRLRWHRLCRSLGLRARKFILG